LQSFSVFSVEYKERYSKMWSAVALALIFSAAGAQEYELSIQVALEIAFFQANSQYAEEQMSYTRHVSTRQLDLSPISTTHRPNASR
jgi:hypothetical protein